MQPSFIVRIARAHYDPDTPFGHDGVSSEVTVGDVPADWDGLEQHQMDDLDLLRYLTDGAQHADNLVWRWSSLMATLNLAGIAAAVTWLSSTTPSPMAGFFLFGFGLMLNLIWCGLIQDGRYVHSTWVRAAQEAVEREERFSIKVKFALDACSPDRDTISSAVGVASRWMYGVAIVFIAAWACVPIVL